MKLLSTIQIVIDYEQIESAGTIICKCSSWLLIDILLLHILIPILPVFCYIFHQKCSQKYVPNCFKHSSFYKSAFRRDNAMQSKNGWGCIRYVFLLMVSHSQWGVYLTVLHSQKCPNVLEIVEMLRHNWFLLQYWTMWNLLFWTWESTTVLDVQM